MDRAETPARKPETKNVLVLDAIIADTIVPTRVLPRGLMAEWIADSLAEQVARVGFPPSTKSNVQYSNGFLSAQGGRKMEPDTINCVI